MSRSLDAAAVEALTRSGLERGVRLSDEDLIRGLLPFEPDSRRLRLFSGVPKLLRLMDGLLTDHQTGEGFVSKFSERFLTLVEWDVDPILEAAFDELNEFYSETQMFSASSEGRDEELEKLKDRTRVAYLALKACWCRSLQSCDEHGAA